jgi:hypothetical protein
MSRFILVAILVSLLAGCVTSDGTYSGSAILSLERQGAAPVRAPPKQTQTAQAPLREKRQVSLRQRAQGPLVRRAEYPIILGAAF